MSWPHRSHTKEMEYLPLDELLFSPPLSPHSQTHGTDGTEFEPEPSWRGRPREVRYHKPNRFAVEPPRFRVKPVHLSPRMQRSQSGGGAHVVWGDRAQTAGDGVRRRQATALLQFVVRQQSGAARSRVGTPRGASPARGGISRTAPAVPRRPQSVPRTTTTSPHGPAGLRGGREQDVPAPRSTDADDVYSLPLSSEPAQSSAAAAGTSSAAPSGEGGAAEEAGVVSGASGSNVQVGATARTSSATSERPEVFGGTRIVRTSSAEGGASGAEQAVESGPPSVMHPSTPPSSKTATAPAEAGVLEGAKQEPAAWSGDPPGRSAGPSRSGAASRPHPKRVVARASQKRRSDSSTAVSPRMSPRLLFPLHQESNALCSVAADQLLGRSNLYGLYGCSFRPATGPLSFGVGQLPFQDPQRWPGHPATASIAERRVSSGFVVEFSQDLQQNLEKALTEKNDLLNFVKDAKQALAQNLSLIQRRSAQLRRFQYHFSELNRRRSELNAENRAMELQVHCFHSTAHLFHEEEILPETHHILALTHEVALAQADVMEREQKITAVRRELLAVRPIVERQRANRKQLHAWNEVARNEAEDCGRRRNQLFFGVASTVLGTAERENGYH